MNFIQRAALVLAKLLTKSVGFTTTDVDWYARNGYSQLYTLLGGGLPSYTGESITVSRAMQCSTVWVCTRAITEAIASMPLPIFRRTGDSTTVETKHPLYSLLRHAPNEYTTAQRFRATLTHHALNYGNGYARIVRRSGGRDVVALYGIHPDQMRHDISDDGKLTYIQTLNGGREQRFPAEDIFHLPNISDDGISGMGVVAMGRQPIALSLVMEEYSSRFFGRGGMPAGAFKKVVPFENDPARQQFREDLTKMYQSRDAMHKQLILEGDWDWKSLGVDPEKAQLVLARQNMIAEICRYYNISPHLAADLSRATFSNIEHLALEFIQLTLLPWMTLWEQVIYNKLLTDAERKAGYYVKHNANSLMRGDFETRMRGYATLLQNGVMSINEIRELEDKDPVVGGDAHHIQLNMQTVAGTGEPTVSEQAQLVKISDGNKKESPIILNLDLREPERKEMRREILKDESGRISAIVDRVVQ